MKNSYWLLVIMILLSSCKGQMIVWNAMDLISIGFTFVVIIIYTVCYLILKIKSWLKNE